MLASLTILKSALHSSHFSSPTCSIQVHYPLSPQDAQVLLTSQATFSVPSGTYIFQVRVSHKCILQFSCTTALYMIPNCLRSMLSWYPWTHSPPPSPTLLLLKPKLTMSHTDAVYGSPKGPHVRESVASLWGCGRVRGKCLANGEVRKHLTKGCRSDYGTLLSSSYFAFP